MRKLRLIALASALAVVGACGSKSSSGSSVDASSSADAGPPDATPAVTIDDVCGTDGAYVMLIDKLIGCQPVLDEVALQGQATATAIGAFCHGVYDPYAANVDLPTYAELQTCLSYISTTACLDLDFNATACDLFHGTVADASGCDSSVQCSDASYCKRASADACGACTAKVADGLPCTADEQCDNGKCVGTQCGHPGKDGDPCVLDANKNSDDCLGERVCNTTTSKCETVNWALDDTCASLKDCGILDTDLYCKPTDGTLNDAGQCATYLALGATCDPNKPGSGLCDLRKYEWCNAGATGGPKCSAPNLVQDGKACGMQAGNQCASGLVCSDPLGTNGGGKCYTPGAKDATCSAQAPCGFFLGCDSGQCEYTDNTPACP